MATVRGATTRHRHTDTVSGILGRSGNKDPQKSVSKQRQYLTNSEALQATAQASHKEPLIKLRGYPKTVTEKATDQHCLKVNFA